MNRRQTSMIVLPVLALALAACGPDDTVATDSSLGTPTSTSSLTPSAPTTPSAPSQTTVSETTSPDGSSTAPATSTTSASTSTASSSTTDAGGGWVTTEHRMRPRTASGAVAPGWKTTPGNTSWFCMDANGSDMEASPYAKSKGVFTCGATAATLLACLNFTGGKVGCMQGSDQKLVMFTSNLRYTGAADPNPWPIKVVLADGTVCSPMSHDQGRHIDDRNGWLGCGKDFQLLTIPGGKYQYFNTKAPQWTAQSVPYNGVAAPKTVQVKQIWFVDGQA